MNHHVAVLAFAFTRLLTSQTEPADFADAVIAEIREAVPKALTHSGSIAVAVVAGGELRWHRTFGFATNDRRRATSDTIYNIGSCSKTLAAWGVMKLVERGDVELDAPVNRYLKRWRVADTDDYDATGVTVRRLLSHSAGLSVHGYPGIETDDPNELALPSLEQSLDGEGDGVTTEPVTIALEPGQAFRYSGGGYTVLQLMIEEVSGESFAEFMRDEVFEPLGMKSTNYGWSKLVEKHVATPYSREGEPLQHRLFTALAAAGCYTTAADLGRFVAAHVKTETARAGRGVLQPATLERLWSAESDAGSRGKNGLGYGVRSGPTGRVVHHNGSNIGWKAMFEAHPDRGIGLVLLTNSDDVGAAQAAVRAWSSTVARHFGDRRKE